MAYQTGSKPKAAGGDGTNKVGRPAGETYKTPTPWRGKFGLAPKTDLSGVAIPDNGQRYGQNQAYTASSGSVADTHKLSQLNANAPVDPALDTLASRGVGPTDDNVNDWQVRNLPPGNVPTHSGTRGASKGGTVPTKTGSSPSGETSCNDATADWPARASKPCSGLRQFAV